MAAVALSPEFSLVALKLQEAACSMSHSEIGGHLSKALGDAGYIHDVNGDDKSGHVVYSQNGTLKRAGYKIRSSEDGSPSAKIDHENASEVSPRTVYDAKESATRTSKGVRLVESVGHERLSFRESSGVNPLVKIISPGRGSSGYYTKQLLERDGPQIFKRGTLMYINHATDAEEAARPEGDWNQLAAVTKADAQWHDDGPDGPALYAPAEVFSKFAQEVKEKAPFTGVSIRAAGEYAESATGRPNPDITLEESKIAPDGRPGLIGRLTRADSIDLVTKAGRDGKLLLESARAQEGDEMDKTEIQALIKESLGPLQAENKQLREMLAAVKAPALISEHLKDIRLPGPIKGKIVESLSGSIPVDQNGSVDSTKLKAMIESSVKDWMDLLPQLGYQANPAALGATMTEAEVKADIEVFQADQTKVAEALADIFVGPKLVKGSVDEQARSLRKLARKAFTEGRAA